MEDYLVVSIPCVKRGKKVTKPAESLRIVVKLAYPFLRFKNFIGILNQETIFDLVKPIYDKSLPHEIF